MKHLLQITISVLCVLSAVSGSSQSPATTANAAKSQDSRCFEMRTYYAAPGKLDELNSRFRNHTLKIFEQHGIQNIGYWLPQQNTDNKLIYLLAFPTRDARDTAWKEFSADPEWRKVQQATEAGGKLVSKVESLLLSTTDYSPTIAPAATPGESRLFELRTYTSAPGKLEELDQRFREKTLPLFAKHGLVSIGYWLPTDPKQGAGNTLIYLLAHKNLESAEAAWKAFRADSDWIAAKSASERNGPLTAQNGVKSIYLIPTDYSPIK